jgi:protein O-GlcNAc transferase
MPASEQIFESVAFITETSTIGHQQPYTMMEIEQAIEYQKAGQLQQAEAIYRQILAREPENPQALHMLGVIALQEGRYGTAEKLIQKALALKPDYAAAYNNLGLVLQDQGRLQDAATAFQRALALTPADPEILINLGNVFRMHGDFSDAATAYKQALALAPNDPEAYNNLGAILISQGHYLAGIERFRQALELAPDHADAHSNLFQAMHYAPGFDAEALSTEARRWASAHAEALTAQAPVHTNERSPNRRLRIGYVSSDLRQHPVGFFFAPVFTHHDKEAFELSCYAGARHPDALTAQCQAGADHWYEVTALSDAALAERIRADRIDILIDLSGHTRGHRLLTFARKPAPIQVTAGGHYDTTGMTAIDYLISDRFHTPQGAERYFSEALIRLPHDYICYGPPDYAPAVAPSPLARHGYVTFGCFNNLAKVTPEVIALWAKILHALPSSRLRLQTRELGDTATCARYHALFKEEGVATSRIELRGHIPHRQLLAAYGEIDIALDPFPYSGGLTTCEALWMGVPVITLSGHCFAGRHSTSHLSNIGLPELTTTAPEEYVAVALALAQDADRLTALRQGLRERLAASPLCDAAGYTRDLEAAYRGMWVKYCEFHSK